MVNPLVPGNAWVRTQHCGCWCLGAKAPSHQYPQCWLNCVVVDKLHTKILHVKWAILRNNITFKIDPVVQGLSWFVFARLIIDFAPVWNDHHSDSFFITGCTWRLSAWQPLCAAHDDRVLIVTNPTSSVQVSVPWQSFCPHSQLLTRWFTIPDSLTVSLQR